MTMHNTFLATAATLAFITGCDVPPAGTAGNPGINSVTGVVSLSELYAGQAPACVNIDFLGNPLDFYLSNTVSGDQVHSIIKLWSSTDGSCTGSVQMTEDYTIAYSDEGTVSAAWDGAVPTRADGSGSLPNPVTASKLKSTVVAVAADTQGIYAVGDVSRDLYYIDDTASIYGYRIYFGSVWGGQSSDGYPLLMYPYAFPSLQ